MAPQEPSEDDSPPEDEGGSTRERLEMVKLVLEIVSLTLGIILALMKVLGVL
jgi:hypothetical protein